MGETDDAGAMGAPPRDEAPTGASAEGANGAAAPTASVAPGAPAPSVGTAMRDALMKLLDPVFLATFQAQGGNLEPLLGLLRGEKDKTAQLGAELAAARQEQERLAAEVGELRAANAQLAVELDAERRRRARLAAALEGGGGVAASVPSTVGELRAWRTAQGYTQRAAAEVLGVGHATIERAEKQPDETRLGRALRAALARDAVELAEARGAERRAEAEPPAAARPCADLAVTSAATRPVEPAALDPARATTGGKAA